MNNTVKCQKLKLFTNQASKSMQYAVYATVQSLVQQTEHLYFTCLFVRKPTVILLKNCMVH